MPDITATGTYTGNTPGFEFLKNDAAYRNSYKSLLFAGATLPTTLEIQYIDDQGTARTLEGGTIASLPTSLTILNFSRPIQIVVTGGSPDFNVTPG